VHDGQSAFIDAMVFYHRLFYELRVEPTPLQKAGVSSQGGWGGGYNNWFGEGKVGMYWGARWMMISFRRFITEQKRARAAWLADNPGADPAAGPEILRLGACQIPRFEAGIRQTVASARCAGINVASPHREQALNFLQYLASEPYSNLINEGADSKPGNMQYNTLERFVNRGMAGGGGRPCRLAARRPVRPHAATQHAGEYRHHR
jgi:ABC-type glycerol-3-phosphate transport system substrate-binding protein